MKIILEGPDGAGKSTLAKKLQAVLDPAIDVAHMKAWDPMDFDFLSQTLRKDNIIWDRHFLSEPIYAHFRNDESKLTYPEIDRLIDIAQDEYVNILVLLPETYGVQDYEPDSIKQRHNELVQAYQGYADRFGLRVIDPRKVNVFDLIKTLK